MKKLNFLLALLLIPLMAWANTDYEAVQLTFNRTGSDAASVSVSVSNEKGETINGVNASLVSTSFAAMKATGVQAITNGSVLAPDTYENVQGSKISYLFCIEGLSSDFTFDSVDVDVYALNASGQPQGNTGSTVRHFQFAVATGSTSDVKLFARKNKDTDICTVPNEKNGLYHSVQSMSADAAANATNPLYLQVELIKTASLGCYAGIGMVMLYTKEGGEGGGEILPDDGHFSADKVYTIHRNNNTSAYIYQSGSTMGTGQLDKTKMFWWSLIPTGNEDCYYIKNVTTGKYVQSSVQTLSSLVPMGDTPVEFQIKQDETPGATTNGYYYMASTDQEISLATDGSLGLNFGATGVVAYYIRTGRGNSYWQIEEGKYEYEPPTVEVTDFAKSIQLYSIPCGASGAAYLSSADIVGDDILAEMHYQATAPSNYFTIFVEQKASVRQGGTLSLTISIANDGSAIRKFAYADWDKDGVFEESVEILDGKANFKVPNSAAIGQYRLRVRVTETDTDGAEDDVIGACYDFIVNVVSAEMKLTWSVDVNDPLRGKALGDENDGILKLSATPLGDASFVGWKLMHSYFVGEIISTDADFEFPLTQSARIVAVFSPNTQDIDDALQTISTDIHNFEGVKYDVAGLKISNKTKGIIIANGKKFLNK